MKAPSTISRQYLRSIVVEELLSVLNVQIVAVRIAYIRDPDGDIQ